MLAAVSVTPSRVAPPPPVLARTIAPTSFGDDPNISLVTFPASAIASSSYVVPETYNCAHVTRRPGPSPRRAPSTHSRSASRSVVFVDSAVANAKAFSLPLVVDGDDDALDVAFARGGRSLDGVGTRSSSPSSSREKTRADEKRRATSDGKGVVVEDEALVARERERRARRRIRSRRALSSGNLRHDGRLESTVDDAEVARAGAGGRRARERSFDRARRETRARRRRGGGRAGSFVGRLGNRSATNERTTGGDGRRETGRGRWRSTMSTRVNRCR
jgi:hypothetical protein